MEHIKRAIFILFLFASSVVLIHSRRNNHQKPSPDVRIACLPLETAQQMQADTHLNGDAQIAYNTAEKQGKPSSYRCYIAFPASDVVCTPRQVADRKDLQTCPSFPAIESSRLTCYFLNKNHEDLRKKLIAQTPLSISDLHGIPVTSIEAAKKILQEVR